MLHETVEDRPEACPTLMALAALAVCTLTLAAQDYPPVK